MLRTTRLTILLLVAAVTLVACGDSLATPTPDVDAPEAADSVVTDLAAAEGITVTVHRTEACSCCGTYEEYLEAAGFTVEQVIHDDMTEVKLRFGIPDDERSCHTNELAGYAAEGHVPAEALLRLVDEAHDVDGISLAGMPAGSPGMPGDQEAPFIVKTFVDGEVVGELGRF